MEQSLFLTLASQTIQLQWILVRGDVGDDGGSIRVLSHIGQTGARRRGTRTDQCTAIDCRITTIIACTQNGYDCKVGIQ